MKVQLNEETLNLYITEAIKQELNEGNPFTWAWNGIKKAGRGIANVVTGDGAAKLARTARWLVRGMSLDDAYRIAFKNTDYEPLTKRVRAYVADNATKLATWWDNILIKFGNKKARYESSNYFIGAIQAGFKGLKIKIKTLEGLLESQVNSEGVGMTVKGYESACEQYAALQRVKMGIEDIETWIAGLSRADSPKFSKKTVETKINIKDVELLETVYADNIGALQPYLESLEKQAKGVLANSRASDAEKKAAKETLELLAMRQGEQYTKYLQDIAAAQEQLHRINMAPVRAGIRTGVAAGFGGAAAYGLSNALHRDSDDETIGGQVSFDDYNNSGGVVNNGNNGTGGENEERPDWEEKFNRLKVR